MEIEFSAHFRKQYRKATKKIKADFYKRLKLFQHNPHHSLLRNHLLTGNYKGYRSINITGDWRAIYSQTKDEQKTIIIFEAIGTHSQLYE